MENASKALMMAAEVLIAMMIISLGVFVFYNYRQTYNDIHSKKAEQQLTQFNSKYTKYIGSSDLTIYDIRTIVNNAKKDNENLDDTEKIDVYLNGLSVVNKSESQWDQDILNQIKNNMDENSTELTKYKCVEPDYYSNGRVKIIKIVNT